LHGLSLGGAAVDGAAVVVTVGAAVVVAGGHGPQTGHSLSSSSPVLLFCFFVSRTPHKHGEHLTGGEVAAGRLVVFPLEISISTPILSVATVCANRMQATVIIIVLFICFLVFSS
jgi:hypothetical protein